MRTVAAERVPRLLLVTDRKTLAPRRFERALERVLGSLPGVPFGVYHREPGLPVRDALREVERLVRLCRGSRGFHPIVVRGRPDLALAAGADGVHLQADGLPPAEVRACWPQLLIGYSGHRVPEVGRVAPHVDYLTFSPIWSSPGKGRAVGTAALERACRAARGTPVLALGGVIGAARIREALERGAFGVAVVRAVLADRDPVGAVAAAALVLGGRRDPRI